MTSTHTLIWGDDRHPRANVARHYRWVCACGFVPRANWPHLSNDHQAHIAATTPAQEG